MTITRTHTRTHTEVGFANPHLRCDECGRPVPAWHDNTACGCTEPAWNNPCEHTAGVTSACPSWGPVDGCTCQPAHDRPARLLSCGWCFEEDGQEVHPHPECPLP
ncbi:hypothetical protein [Actinacidiphila sp. ITFR-21]|uniref:hypothetical protein n=1 Tax=Actinacidiphila sp. ITFR-21 TaxID=3075199 RepID=UPI00288BE212|nr:hypothetical protein [Streptomyces sp. ITFR-21]WNI20354.1 hypothetical protein RLT57_32645 [Streptomyces sp. ITFR-21]